MDRGRFAIFLMWGRSVRQAMFSVALALVICAVTSATADDLYEVRGVKVDETDQTATAARDHAFAVGERRGWDMLVERLVDPQQRRPLPEFAQRDIGDAVQDFWVTQEKISSVRYIATLNYTFRPERVRRLLASRGVRFTGTPSPLQVVVPVFETPAGRKLWDDPNPWRAAWHDVQSPWLTPLRVPAGDLADLATITADQAAVADPQRLADLLRRYETTDAVVAIAAVETVAVPPTAPGRDLPTPGLPARELKVRGLRVTPAGTQELPERTYPYTDDVPPDETFRQAAEALAHDLEAAWRRAASEGGTGGRASTSATVRVPAAGIDEWVTLRRRLEAIPQVGAVRLLSLSPQDARIQMAFSGSTEQLAAALAEKGLALRSEEGEWVLSTNPGTDVPESNAVSPE
jgi:hypothetical protein